MSLPFLLPAAKLLTAAVGVSVVLTSAGGASPVGATPARSRNPSPAVALPTVVTGFAPGAEVVVRLACGPTLPDGRADDAGVLQLPPDLLAQTVPGAYRLLVSGPPAPVGDVSAGNLVVTVPRTEIVGVVVGADHRATVDPDVPAPDC